MSPFCKDCMELDEHAVQHGPNNPDGVSGHGGRNFHKQH